ncbi:MAG: nucleoside deaminase [Cytophagales bacterium]|nr:MAG: nucleoside deaminase [Cytophagales bacterium]
MTKYQFMEEAVKLSLINMQRGEGGPFGAIIVKDGQIIAKANNQVLKNNDPTAHAEVVAIREACKVLGVFQLDGCELYTSCEPCPMCLGAIYWARPSKVYYANTRQDAAAIDFDDAFIYEEINMPFEKRKIPMEHLHHPQAIEAFKKWAEKNDKTLY